MRMASQLQVYGRSGRYRTQGYAIGGSDVFTVSEKTSAGVLLTDFNVHGEVISQRYLKKSDAVEELRQHVPEGYEVSVAAWGAYAPVMLDVECSSCSRRTVVRELDLVEPSLITNIPVVPIFVCRSCNKKYYSMTRSYLTSLVDSNPDLFEKEELAMREKDEEKFIDTLNEYIIRIFASKNIKRIVAIK